MHTRVIDVRLRRTGNFQDCDCPHLWFDIGAPCIIASKRGERFGTVVSKPRIVDHDPHSGDRWYVVRAPTEEDYRQLEEDAELERLPP